MKLYLARHGEAVPKHINPDAPLSDNGRREAEAVAAFMAGSQAQLEQIRHSGKTRARQTAEIFAAAMGGNVNVEVMDGLDPLDPTEQVLETILRFSGDTLIVGHLPFMGRLADRLLSCSSATGLVEFNTSTVVCLHSANRREWTLKWILSPELFPPNL